MGLLLECCVDDVVVFCVTSEATTKYQGKPSGMASSSAWKTGKGHDVSSSLSKEWPLTHQKISHQEKL
jgi:hypothetical protein